MMPNEEIYTDESFAAKWRAEAEQHPCYGMQREIMGQASRIDELEKELAVRDRALEFGASEYVGFAMEYDWSDNNPSKTKQDWIEQARGDIAYQARKEAADA